MGWMLGTFIFGMVALGFAIDAFLDNKYNPEKHFEKEPDSVGDRAEG